MESKGRMPPQGDEHYDYYPLDASDGTALLPEGQELVVHRASGHMLLIDWEMRVVKAEATFDERGCLLLRMLLAAWPAYVPYERFLTHLTHYSVHDLARRIEQVRDADVVSSDSTCPGGLACLPAAIADPWAFDGGSVSAWLPVDALAGARGRPSQNIDVYIANCYNA